MRSKTKKKVTRPLGPTGASGGLRSAKELADELHD